MDFLVGDMLSIMPSHVSFEVYRNVEQEGWFKHPRTKQNCYGTNVEKRLIDVVFFDKTMNKDEVRKSLIEHDGYPYDIYLIQGTRK